MADESQAILQAQTRTYFCQVHAKDSINNATFSNTRDTRYQYIWLCQVSANVLKSQLKVLHQMGSIQVYEIANFRRYLHAYLICWYKFSGVVVRL